MSRRKIKSKPKKFSELEKKIISLALEGKSFIQVQEELGTDLEETIQVMTSLFSKLPKSLKP